MAAVILNWKMGDLIKEKNRQQEIIWGKMHKF
jgi:hypothetical protein